ncbi:hypothetical protein NP493_623g01040 [Ridgeia piscesae]|uniref:Uncharacterized protein n=1 Tax=Ridgeia piscesae TaxID=27915 RepID=A0AAD9KTH2_RIDPI|nr:hypothetical protein NP493_623g01040 [Ridgeia piscesae]
MMFDRPATFLSYRSLYMSISRAVKYNVYATIVRHVELGRFLHQYKMKLRRISAQNLPRSSSGITVLANSCCIIPLYLCT